MAGRSQDLPAGRTRGPRLVQHQEAAVPLQVRIRGYRAVQVRAQPRHPGEVTSHYISYLITFLE